MSGAWIWLDFKCSCGLFAGRLCAHAEPLLAWPLDWNLFFVVVVFLHLKKFGWWENHMIWKKYFLLARKIQSFIFCGQNNQNMCLPKFYTCGFSLYCRLLQLLSTLLEFISHVGKLVGGLLINWICSTFTYLSSL